MMCLLIRFRKKKIFANSQLNKLVSVLEKTLTYVSNKTFQICSKSEEIKLKTFPFGLSPRGSFLSILCYDHDPEIVDMEFKQILYPHQGRMQTNGRG